MSAEQIERLLEKIRKLQELMTDVATFEEKIENVEDEYNTLYQEVDFDVELLQELDIPIKNPSNFSDLWKWCDYYSHNLENKRSAKVSYVNELYKEIVLPINRALYKHKNQQTSDTDFIQDLQRRFQSNSFNQRTDLPIDSESPVSQTSSTIRVMKDFFISYTGNDRTWAEWIAWVLEEAGHSVVIQAWDFRPGGNLVLDMQKATEANRTIAVLSSLYLQKPFPQSEWAAAFAQDPTSANRKLIPVRVEDCNPTGLLAQIVYTDVFNCDETEAQQRLLTAVKDGRMKPEQRPIFPGKTVERQIPEHVPFPGAHEGAFQNPQPIASQPAPRSLTSSQKRRLEQKQATLDDALQIREEKLRQLRKSEAIEAGTAIKFQLQQQIKAEEEEIAKLTAEFDDIEQQLLSGSEGADGGTRDKIDLRESQGAIVNPATGTVITQQFGNTTNINTGGGDYAGGSLSK